MDKQKGETCEDILFGDISDKMTDLMIQGFVENISKINTSIEGISKGSRKDKDIIIAKYKQELAILEKLKEMVKKQNEIQKELIQLSEQKSKIDDEINKILIS
jgi:hypothetical protein